MVLASRAGRRPGATPIAVRIAAGDGVAFAAPATVLERIGRASSIAVSAYTLDPRGAMIRALDAAAERGADVSVTLDDCTANRHGRELRRDARASARDLRAHGVHVALAADVHLKAAVVDGTAFLDDRNWSAGDETIVATSRAADVAVVRDALAGRAPAATGLAVDKRSALAREVAVVRGADRVDLESESFGACAVSAALRARAASGAHVRLLVNARVAFERGSARERALLGELVAAGVEVRTTRAAEKLCVTGDAAWVGSANATYPVGPMSDWGLTIGDPALHDALAATFERNWSTARPFHAGRS